MTDKTPSRDKPAKVLGVSPTVNMVLSIVFLVLGAILVIILVVPSLFLMFATDSCGSRDCTFIEFGFWWTLLSPTVLWLATLAVTIVMLVKRRGAWLFSLLGVIAVGLSFWLGVTIVFAQLG